ncbi:dachshund homolog 2 isoform X3 [Bufo gargarizans]|uniref:dachshund homolog 2 isoform X3 n=1 Tax=Bufo gargarizans TaxID=30331 RepID=UPI001CF2B366|nr:dachshund homolog 2 isoform X3 [Bufo gargarizans]
MAVSAPPPPVLSPAESPRPLLSGYSPGPGAGGSECRMVEVHGVRVASFVLDGQELICLPQVFELFLKHLVGGLHTVYTKLKRLDITPVVCTVEQVRVLRGLGAIQPGVNRCKLITRRDFEALYQDCTNASSRPGRPPKRSLGVAIQENARLLPHGVQSLLSPGLISHTGLTAAAMAEAMKLQKMKLMAISSLHGSGSQNGTESENEELNSNAGLDLPFMVMPHPLLPVSLPPASVAMAMNQMNHLNTIANMAAAAQMHSPLSRVGASVIKSCIHNSAGCHLESLFALLTDKTLTNQERIQDSPSPAPSIEDGQRPGSHASSHQSSSVSSSPCQLDNIADRVTLLPRDGDFTDQDTGPSIKKMSKEKDDIQIAIPIIKPTLEKVQLAGQTLPPGFPAPFLFADGLSSVETLLTNIQGLLKVAVDNARVQEKQIQQEKKELKMELCRERELRENLERQLTAELQSRATIQKRLKKEKKAKRKLQEALEFESKRREQVEQALKQATAGDGLRMLNDACIPEMETEHNGSQLDSPPMQENRAYIKPPLMY